MSAHYHIDVIASAWSLVANKHGVPTIEESEQTVAITPASLEHISMMWQELVEAFTAEKRPHYNAGLAFLCAILHDAIKDLSSTHEEIALQFGADVADGVRALTKNEKLPTEQARVADCLMRIRKQPKEVWMVGMASWIIQLAPPPEDWSKERAAQHFQSARMAHDSLADAHRALAMRLSAKIDEYRLLIDRIPVLQ